MPKAAAASGVLHVVASERHVEALAARGESALTLRALIAQLAESSVRRERAGPELTRLLAEIVSERPELADFVDSGIGALRRAGIGASDLAAHAMPRAQLLARALSSCDARLEAAGLRDGRGDAWVAASALGPDTLKGVREVRIQAWAIETAGHAALVAALQRELSRRGGEVVVRFPGLVGEESARAVERELSRLEALWAAHNDTPALATDDELNAMRLDLRLVSTPNAESEARVAVRAVQDALAEGAKLDRIAIVPLELSEGFLEELRSALRRARLPFSEPRGRPAIAGPNVHAALELLRLAARPVRRDALLDVLAAPGLRPARWFGVGGMRASFALRELLARVPVGVDHDGTLLLERARFVAQQSGSERDQAALSGLERLLQDLTELSAPRSRRELAAAFLDLIDSLGLLRVGHDVLRRAVAARDAGAPELLCALSDDARGAEALELSLERLTGAAARLGLEQQALSPRELLNELERALEGAQPLHGGSRAAALAIARPADVAGLALELAVVCRASAACFGRAGASAGATLLGSELYEALPRARRPDSARDQESLVLLSLNALLAASKRALIVWSTSDAAAETTESTFVRGFIKLGHAQREEPGSPLAPGASRVVPLGSFAPEVRARARLERERQAAFYGATSERAGQNPLGRVSTLSPWLATDQPALPVTKLERYGECAFLGFAATALRAVRGETIGDALGPRERGTLIHAAAAAALLAIRERMHQSDAELLRVALEAARVCLSEHAGSALRGAALSSALADVESLVRWSLDSRDYALRDAERAFGDGEAWGPLVLGPFRLSGRIDRVDVAQGGRRLRIIDYKSDLPPAKSDAAALQAWLYARKAAEELDAVELESLYLGLKRRVVKPVWVFRGEAGAPELLEREQQALSLLERFRDGHVAAEPLRTSRCARCDARDICRRPLSAPPPEDSSEDG